MIDMNEVHAATDTLARAFEEYKSCNDQRLTDIERRGSADVLLNEKLSRMDQSLNKLQDDVSSVKTVMRRPAKGVLQQAFPGEGESEYKCAFMRYVAKGSEGDLSGLQTKDMDIIGDQLGGYMVPVEMAERIVTRQFDTTPMRQLATVMSISSEAVEMLRDTNEPDAQWVSELGTRTDTGEGAIGRIRIPVHELYAHTRTVRAGMHLTSEQAGQLLDDDLRIAERAVSRLVRVPVTDNQFAALVSFVFNVGTTNFERSTLLKLLNRGWYEQVPAQLMRWNRAKGEVLGGLARRRAAEARLWNAPDRPETLPVVAVSAGGEI